MTPDEYKLRDALEQYAKSVFEQTLSIVVEYEDGRFKAVAKYRNGNASPLVPTHSYETVREALQDMCRMIDGAWRFRIVQTALAADAVDALRWRDSPE